MPEGLSHQRTAAPSRCPLPNPSGTSLVARRPRCRPASLLCRVRARPSSWQDFRPVAGSTGLRGKTGSAEPRKSLLLEDGFSRAVNFREPAAQSAGTPRRRVVAIADAGADREDRMTHGSRNLVSAQPRNHASMDSEDCRSRQLGVQRCARLAMRCTRARCRRRVRPCGGEVVRPNPRLLCESANQSTCRGRCSRQQDGSDGGRRFRPGASAAPKTADRLVDAVAHALPARLGRGSETRG